MCVDSSAVQLYAVSSAHNGSIKNFIHFFNLFVPHDRGQVGRSLYYFLMLERVLISISLLLIIIHYRFIIFIFILPVICVFHLSMYTIGYLNVTIQDIKHSRNPCLLILFPALSTTYYIE